jgi:hypothetical protein
LSALCAGRALPPDSFILKDSWYSFLLEAESTPGPVRPEGFGQFKNPPHRGLNCDLPACSIVRLTLIVYIISVKRSDAGVFRFIKWAYLATV